MDGNTDLSTLEREAYRTAWSDGIVDIYVGVSLLFMGAMWTWVPGMAGLSGLLPAVLVLPMLSLRRRFVEDRLGHVEWRPARRGWERRNQSVLLAAGLGLFLLAIVASLALGGGVTGDRSLAPGIMAWLLAVLALGLAFLLDARRMVLYAAVLAAGGVVVVLLEADPGWPMLAGGAVATGVGVAMLRRFIERYPVIRA